MESIRTGWTPFTAQHVVPEDQSDTIYCQETGTRMPLQGSKKLQYARCGYVNFIGMVLFFYYNCQFLYLNEVNIEKRLPAVTKIKTRKLNMQEVKNYKLINHKLTQYSKL